MVLFICNDLFFQPQVQQAAKSVNLPLVTRANPAAGLEWLHSDPESTIQAVIVDLKTVSDESQLVELMRVAVDKSGGTLKSVAYGPHVKVELLDAATQAGFAHVLTQGQFNRDVRNVLQQMAS